LLHPDIGSRVITPTTNESVTRLRLALARLYTDRQTGRSRMLHETCNTASLTSHGRIKVRKTHATSCMARAVPRVTQARHAASVAKKTTRAPVAVQPVACGSRPLEYVLLSAARQCIYHLARFCHLSSVSGLTKYNWIGVPRV
jgi:hypothetical protein